MADPLKIELELDRSKAEREAKAFHDGEKKRVAESKAATEAAERAKTQAAVGEGAARTRDADKQHRAYMDRLREQARAYAHAMQERIRETAKVQKAESDAARSGVEGMRGLTASVTASALGMAGLATAATSASAAIEEAFRQARERAREATNETLGLQRTLLQMANMRGTGTQEELRAVVSEMAQTGMGFQDAAALKTEGQLGARGFANEQEFQEFLQRSGRLGTISGQSGATMGRAARLIGDMGGGSLTANEAEARLLLANELAQRGGLNVTAFLEQSRQTRDIVSSGALTEGQAGGLLALYAARGGGAADVKALVEATAGDQRGTIGAALGWSDRLAGVQDPLAFLQGQGLDSGAAKAIAEFHAGRGRWEADIAPILNQAPRAGTIDQRFQEMAASDPAVRQARTEAAAQMSTIAHGQHGSLREQLRRLAYERMKAAGETSARFEDFDQGISGVDLFNPYQWSRIWNDESREGLDQRAAEMLLEQARAAGIDVSFGSRAHGLASEIMDLDPQGAGRRSEAEIDRRFNELGAMIQERGGDPLPGLDRFEAAVDRFAQHAQALPRPVPQPLQGAPVQPPARPR